MAPEMEPAPSVAPGSFEPGPFEPVVAVGCAGFCRGATLVNCRGCVVGAAAFPPSAAVALRRVSNSLSLRSNRSIRSSRMRSRSLTPDEPTRPFAPSQIPGLKSAGGVEGSTGAGCWAEAAPIITVSMRPHEAISLITSFPFDFIKQSSNTLFRRQLIGQFARARSGDLLGLLGFADKSKIFHNSPLAI